MREVVYVTEPSAINLREARRLIPAKYELVSGNTSFDGVIPETCTTLLIRSATVINPSVKDVFSNLKSIIRIGTGVDSIDMAFCDRENVHVYTAPGANADAVSDYIVCMMLVALRKITTLTPHDVATWNRFKFTGRSMSNQSIGIIGFGNIGRQVHDKLQGFACKGFFIYDPFMQEDRLPNNVTSMSSVGDVFAHSDIVTLHLPLTPQTRHLISRRELELLPEQAILLNASRGGIVKEEDVVEAVRSRGLTYIADTVENEPEVAPALLQEDNILITPHIASLTKESESNMLKLAIDNFLSQAPSNGRLPALIR